MESKLKTDKKKRETAPSKSKRIALLGVMTALAMVFGYIEHLIPFSVGIYGIKLGIANLAVLLMLFTVGAPWAFAVNMLRILLCGILFGNTVSLIYSLAGGILSFSVMLIAKRFRFGSMGISITGGVAHNIGQLAAAALMLDNLKIMFYLPVLLISGAIAGALIGLAADLAIKKLPPKILS